MHPQIHLGSSSRNRLDVLSWASVCSETGLAWVGLSYRPSPHCGPLSPLSLMMGSLESHSGVTMAFTRGMGLSLCPHFGYLVQHDWEMKTLDKRNAPPPCCSNTLTVQNKPTKNKRENFCEENPSWERKYPWHLLSQVWESPLEQEAPKWAATEQWWYLHAANTLLSPWESNSGFQVPPWVTCVMRLSDRFSFLLSWPFIYNLPTFLFYMKSVSRAADKSPATWWHFLSSFFFLSHKTRLIWKAAQSSFKLLGIQTASLSNCQTKRCLPLSILFRSGHLGQPAWIKSKAKFYFLNTEEIPALWDLKNHPVELGSASWERKTELF